MATYTTPRRSEFDTWLTTHRPVGFAWTGNTLAVSDGAGAWNVSLGTKTLADRFLASLAASGRRVWALGAARTAIRLASRLRCDVAELAWLYDATTAANVCRPGAEVEAAVGSVEEQAAAVAVMIRDLVAGADHGTRVNVTDSVFHEQLWRARQARGWRLDVDLLERELEQAEHARKVHQDRLGIDLTDTSKKNAARIHEWLAIDGIHVLDRNGRPSLARDDYDHADIPVTPAAQARWQKFRRVRSVASRGAKLRELKNASKDGRLSTELAVRGTRTGRMISRRPALQNINRDLRGLLVADPGDVLVSLDFDQVEPRVAAALSGCEALATAVHSDDFYADVARSVWGDEAFHDGKVVPERRQQAKVLTISIFYGKQAKRTAFDLGISVEEAQHLLNAMWHAYPGLAAFDAELKARFAAGEVVTTDAGRIVPRPPKGLYASLNALVQATAADVFYGAVRRVVERIGDPGKLFIGLFDELVIECPAEEAEEFRYILQEEMPTTFRGVRISGEAEILGPAWRK